MCSQAPSVPQNAKLTHQSIFEEIHRYQQFEEDGFKHPYVYLKYASQTRDSCRDVNSCDGSCHGTETGAFYHSRHYQSVLRLINGAARICGAEIFQAPVPLSMTNPNTGWMFVNCIEIITLLEMLAHLLFLSHLPNSLLQKQTLRLTHRISA